MEQVDGTFECPLCGYDHPHEHTGEEIAISNGARSVEAESEALRVALKSLKPWAQSTANYQKAASAAVVLRAMRKRLATE